MKITTPQNKEEKNVKGPNPKKQIETKKLNIKKDRGVEHTMPTTDKTKQEKRKKQKSNERKATKSKSQFQEAEKEKLLNKIRHSPIK